jgi:hypothetical protein
MAGGKLPFRVVIQNNTKSKTITSVRAKIVVHLKAQVSYYLTEAEFVAVNTDLHLKVLPVS